MSLHLIKRTSKNVKKKKDNTEFPPASEVLKAIDRLVLAGQESSTTTTSFHTSQLFFFFGTLNLELCRTCDYYPSEAEEGVDGRTRGGGGVEEAEAR